MCRYSPAQRLGEKVVVKRAKITVGKSDDVPLQDCCDLLLLRRTREPDA
jgi:hypothetical protein